ncbi:MAG TPA: hypothetical protein VN894_04280, partial [Polyangiaceae bacterium]|nr:hypothetical protein [Polyangiaceae bacterium]
DDFSAVFGDKHLTLVDQLIMRLINARNDLDDPVRGLQARSLIDRIMQTSRPLTLARRSHCTS